MAKEHNLKKGLNHREPGRTIFRNKQNDELELKRLEQEKLEIQGKFAAPNTRFKKQIPEPSAPSEEFFYSYHAPVASN